MVWGRVLGSCCLASCSVASIYAINNKTRHGRVFPYALAATHSTATNNIDKLDIATSSGSAWDENWDRRDPKTMQKKKKDKSNTDEEEIEKPTATRRLYLIRHGQYDVHGVTDEERTLTNLGRLQAAMTARRLAEVGLEPAVIVFSTMQRAKETFEAFAEAFPNAPSQSCDLLREGAPCRPQPPSKHWRPEHHQFYEEGARIEAAFRKYFHRADVSQKEDSVEILVCHANVIRYFVCRALQLPPEAWLRISLAHCSITQINIRPTGHVSLYSLGDASHMPPNMISRT